MREIVHPSPLKRPIGADVHAGEWVAILNREVYDHDFDLDALFKRLDRAGVGETAAVMQVLPPGTVWV